MIGPKKKIIKKYSSSVIFKSMKNENKKNS